MVFPTHYVWPHSVSIIEEDTPTRYSFQFTLLLIFWFLLGKGRRQKKRYFAVRLTVRERGG